MEVTTTTKLTGMELIAIERQEQIEKHGRTVQRDKDLNQFGQLLLAAFELMQPDKSPVPSTPMGWDQGMFRNMCMKPRRERLILAGALLLADNARRGYPAWAGMIASIAKDIDELDNEN